MNYQLYVNGNCINGHGKRIVVVNPATGKDIASFLGADKEQTELALIAAQDSFHMWSELSINERIEWILKLRNACRKRREGLVDLLSCEVGKTRPEAERDVDSFLSSADFYIEEAKRIYDLGLPDYQAKRGEMFHFVINRPVGVTVGHLAWNWPLHNMGLKMWPALASGCTCVIKPSSNTPLTAMVVGSIAEGIGLPAGVMNIVVGPSFEVGKYLNESRIPRLISLIGSSVVGRQVAAQAATSIKHFSFELGGNAPCIIMPDANLEDAVNFIVGRKTFNCGQGCANVNRVYVHSSQHDRLIVLLEGKLRAKNVGWGSGYESAMGPMIDINARNRVLALVEQAVKQGAKRVYGGMIPDNLPEELTDGAFITPCLLDDVKDEMDIANTEIFGPVISVLSFDSFDDVLKRANNTEYGLSSYVFTHDSRVIAKASESLEFGEVMVNLAGDGIQLPHCGIKESGIGCDRSKWSLDDYLVIKRVSVQP